MSFMDLSIVGSDTASDLFWEVKQYKSPAQSLQRLTKECRVDHGKWNTPGFINVALILVEPWTRKRLWDQPGFAKLLRQVNEAVQKTVEFMAKEPPDPLAAVFAGDDEEPPSILDQLRELSKKLARLAKRLDK